MSKNKQEKQPKEPVLFEESYIPEQKKPPWLFILLILFILISGIWNRMANPARNQAQPAEVQPSQISKESLEQFRTPQAPIK